MQKYVFWLIFPVVWQKDLDSWRMACVASMISHTVTSTMYGQVMTMSAGPTESFPNGYVEIMFEFDRTRNFTTMR